MNNEVAKDLIRNFPSNAMIPGDGAGARINSFVAGCFFEFGSATGKAQRATLSITDFAMHFERVAVGQQGLEHFPKLGGCSSRWVGGLL